MEVIQTFDPELPSPPDLPSSSNVVASEGSKPWCFFLPCLNPAVVVDEESSKQIVVCI